MCDVCVRYLLNAGADVHAQTQTGDTALTYACENGHTDVADVLLRAGAELEHESEGGRTPLMKACRAGHVCTVQFLVSKVAAHVQCQSPPNLQIKPNFIFHHFFIKVKFHSVLTKTCI